MRSHPFLVVVVAVVALAACSSSSHSGAAHPSSSSSVPSNASSTPTGPPPNPFLADSAYPVSHHNAAQNDSTPTPGPTGPSRTLGPGDFDWLFAGPAHFGEVISAAYPNGQRVIWSNGGDRILKIDEQSFKVLATYPLPGKHQWTEAEADAALASIEHAAPAAQPQAAINLAAKTLQGLAGVYAMIDRDGNFYVTNQNGLTVYGDAKPGDAASPIVVRAHWDMPSSVSGALVGMNMTYDGWIILVTENGDVIALSRDLHTQHIVKLPHSENAAAYTARAVRRGETGYGWVRNSYAIDDQGGIYIAADAYLFKVVWTGSKLSVASADGAWADPYRDSSGLGTGATPVLMGFGSNQQHLVALTDGDTLMNFTVYWRDAIPAGWKQLPGAPSARVAGFLPANFGDPSRTKSQTEQAAVVAGFGAVIVNNQPASIPAGFPTGRAATLLSGYLGTDPRFTPHGMEKFEWDPTTQKLSVAWVNNDVSSPNSVPYISVGSNLVYTIGARDGMWTLEGVDFGSGQSDFHYVLGGLKYDSLFAGVIVDDNGDVIYGTPFGKMRIHRG